MATRKSTEKTSPAVAKTASRVLSSPKSTPAQKSVAGSALRQAAGGTTSPAVAKKAGGILENAMTKSAVKRVAGSVLTQVPSKKSGK
jgi:hypothetical protein